MIKFQSNSRLGHPKAERYFSVKTAQMKVEKAILEGWSGKKRVEWWELCGRNAMQTQNPEVRV